MSQPQRLGFGLVVEIELRLMNTDLVRQVPFQFVRADVLSDQIDLTGLWINRSGDALTRSDGNLRRQIGLPSNKTKTAIIQQGLHRCIVGQCLKVFEERCGGDGRGAGEQRTLPLCRSHVGRTVGTRQSKVLSGFIRCRLLVERLVLGVLISLGFRYGFVSCF